MRVQDAISALRKARFALSVFCDLCQSGSPEGLSGPLLNTDLYLY